MKPAYTVIPINLENAGFVDIFQQGDVLHVGAILSGSALALDVPLYVKAAEDIDSADEIRLYYGNRIRAASKGFRVRWDSQPGVTAELILTSGINAVDLDTAPPVRLNTGASGGSIDADAVSVTSTAGVVVAANASRKSVIIQNLGSAPIFIGGSTVADSDGLKVDPGQSLTVDNTTAAIYGVTASGTADVRYLEES